jgi:hypothetical protein
MDRVVNQNLVQQLAALVSSESLFEHAQKDVVENAQ